jgi:predicted aspartyl protease
MITGIVTDDGVPLIRVALGDREWPAIIDTGFNGGLELPEACRDAVEPQFLGRIVSVLAGGMKIEEDAFRVEFLFDGGAVESEATFVDSEAILIGTALLVNHQLTIDFPAKSATLERATPER